MRMRRPRKQDGAHLEFIRALSCCVCGDNTSTEAAHIRTGSNRAAKRWTGMGERPDDAWTLPLCGECHQEQHKGGEIDFWERNRIDPFATAAFLALHSGDFEAAEMVVSNARRK